MKITLVSSISTISSLRLILHLVPDMTWWHTPVIPEIGNWRQGGEELRVSLSYVSEL